MCTALSRATATPWTLLSGAHAPSHAPSWSTTMLIDALLVTECPPMLGQQSSWPTRLRLSPSSRGHRLRRSISAVHAIGALWSVVAVSAVNAQSIPPDTALQVLVLPSSAVLRCRVERIAGGTPGGGGVRFHFQVGDENWRETRDIEVLYDLSGAPVTLLDAASRITADGDAVVDGVAVTFGPDGTATGFHRRDIVSSATSRGAREAPRIALPPITAEESTRSVALAKWLWLHRCGRSTSPDATARPSRSPHE